MRFAKRLLVSLSSLDMFGQEARFRPINIRSIEDHAVVRIGIRGRKVTIEVHRASSATAVGTAKTISTAKTASRTSAFFAGAKVLQKNESESQRAICFVKQSKSGRGAVRPCVLCALRALCNPLWLRAHWLPQFTEDHAAARMGIRGRMVTMEVHRASIATVVGSAQTRNTAKTARNSRIRISVAIAGS